MLRLHNNLTLKTEVFIPAEEKKVKMYTCGPSTYQRAHVGNYRTFLFEDILQRYLEYLGYDVTRLMTLTDIEDKAIASAEAANISVEELTNRNEKFFSSDCEKLRVKRPDYPVRASTIVNQAVDLTETLLEKGIAYKHTYLGAENVYFNPKKFPSFGKLSHLDLKKWPERSRRFHLDTYPGMPWNKGDFVLWHGCRDGDRVCWDTSLGRGRPAWNIQDAAMVTKHLGFGVDLACGGRDNLVRHHDYTLAVAEAVSGIPFARYWLHGGHLYVDGKKMSKSRGNVLYLDDLADKGYCGEHIRFFLIYGAYRKRRQFTWLGLAKTSSKLDNFKKAVGDLAKASGLNSHPKARTLAQSISFTFRKYMDNDLDVKGAFDALHDSLGRLQRFSLDRELSRKDAEAAITDLRETDHVLQIIF